MQAHEVSWPLRLRTLADRYESAMRYWLASTDLPSTLELDACFAALRLQQRVRWADGSGAVDELGMRAQDLLLACKHRGRSSAVARDALVEHDRALHRVCAAIDALNEREVSA